MSATCPTCKRAVEWSTSKWRPFCSERCKLIDLGAWASDKHAIPDTTIEDTNDTTQDWMTDPSDKS